MLKLTAADELVALENMSVLQQNGFEAVLESDQPARRRLRLVVRPMSTEFDIRGASRALSYSALLNPTFTVGAYITGGMYGPSHPGIEGSISTQYPEAMAYPTPLILYSIGGELKWSPGRNDPSPGGTYLEWLNYTFNQPTIPQTVSISHGNAEQDFPAEYATALATCSRGSVREAGASATSSRAAMTSSATATARMAPEKSSSLPTSLHPYGHGFAGLWVTSVDGTTGDDPKVAASLFGGGLSTSAASMLASTSAFAAVTSPGSIPNSNLCGPEGRDIPNISAQALKILVVVTAGRRCSTPTVVDIISLLNGFLLASGKAPLGSLNTCLYGLDLPCLSDITFGSNPGHNTDGFSAINGWDRAPWITVLGNLDFEKLQRIHIS
ncbi:hypothetical protein BJY52DRAFT_1184122 [Lactarius psammicola]|nr:hypothetical protein BJY52DRAFT_1184122 [Lactarius psammicola]